MNKVQNPSNSVIHHRQHPLNYNKYWRMMSSGMLRRVALVRTDVSEELSASFIRVTRIGGLWTTLAPKRRFLQEPHGVTSQKTSFFIVTAVKTSNLTTNTVRYDVSTAVTMKKAVFWAVTLCCSCKNRRLGRTYRLHHRGDKNRSARNNVSSN
jgi:hypothetical protein